MATKSLSFLLFGEDVTAGKAFKKVAADAEASGSKIKGAFGGSNLLAVGALAAGLGLAVKSAGNFEQATNVLVTAAGESAKNLGSIRKGILDISSSTGTSWQQITDGMYQLEKAGYRGADALKVETAAAQAAREENAPLGTVTAALTSIMASYHLKASDAVMVTNELKTAAGESKTTLDALAGSLSTVLPIASANKISFADVAGSLATLTQHGTSADEATQEVANTIRNLAKPNAVAAKEMAQLGISSVDVAQKLGDGPGGRGLAGTLNYLSQTVLKKMGPSGTLLLNTFNQSQTAAADATTEFNALAPATQKVAQQFIDGTMTQKEWTAAVKAMTPEQANLAKQFGTTENSARGFQSQLNSGLSKNQTYSDAIGKMTGGVNGLNTTLQITGESMTGTNTRIATIAKSAKDAGTDVSGWDSTQKLFNVRLDQFKNSAINTGVSLGEKLLPAAEGVMSFLGAHQTTLLAAAAALVGIKVAIGGVKLAQEAWAASQAIGVAARGIYTSAVGIAGSLGAAGPIGLAAVGIAGIIGIATKGFGLFGSGAKAQIKPLQDLTDAITQDGDAIGKLTTTQVANKLETNGAYDAALKLGIAQSTVLAATLGNIPAQKEIAAAVSSAKTAYDAANHSAHTYVDANGIVRTSTKGATDAQKDANSAANKLAGSYGNLTGVLGASKHAADNVAAAVKGIPKTATTKVAVTGAPKAMDALTSVGNALYGINGYTAQANVDVLISTINSQAPGLAAIGAALYGGAHLKASGGTLEPGWTKVGEQGPEWINTGGGGHVYTASQSKGIGAAAPNIQVTINPPVGMPSQEVGRQLVKHLEMYFSAGGRLKIR